MIYRFFKSTVLFFFFTTLACGRNSGKNQHFKEVLNKSIIAKKDSSSSAEIIVGANRTSAYLPLLKGKKVGIVANAGTIIFRKGSENNASQNYISLVDSLVTLNIDVKKVFAPEHGFRGTADAGETITDGKDIKTGLPVISLYGNSKKPTSEQLQNIEILVFDLQDVGARFYTYISTLTYVMEACTENNIPLILLDRPNPNAGYIDGPVLDPAYKSFVGMHPVPIVYGMTMGEYAKMLNGEKWLKNGEQCILKVIALGNYKHSKKYSLPVKPSPNLPNDRAINLYPSLCFFEGTTVNAGRGTNKQFQVFGAPSLDKKYFTYSYTPQSNEGAKNPKHKGKICFGRDLSKYQDLSEINLEWLIEAYNHTLNKPDFFNSYFTKLAGNKTLKQQIEAGKTAEEIRSSWQPELEKFKKTRSYYLIYKP